MELDRAFVINGDDLRVALADDGGHPALVSNPRDVAEYILGRIAQPAGKAGIRVTEGSIASALEGFTLIGRPVTDPGDTVQVDVDDPDAFAKALFAALCRMAALREPDGGQEHPAGERIEITRGELAALLAKLRVGTEQPEEWKMGPTAMLARPEAVAEVIASHARGLRGNACCEHAPDDDELSFLAECVRRLDAMGDLAVGRCMSYLADRYAPE